MTTGPEVIVSGWIAWAPQDRAQVLEAFARCARTSREEPGCVDYAVAPDPDDPGRVRVLEHWASRADLDAHLALPHVAQFRAAVADLTRTGRSLTLSTVSESRPFSTSTTVPSTTQAGAA